MPQGSSRTLDQDHRIDVAAPVAQRGRFALWSPVLLGAGAAIYFALQAEPALETGWIALAMGLIAGLSAIRFGALPIFGPVAFLASGFGLAVLNTAVIGGPVLQQQTPAGDITGRVIDAYGHEDGRPRVLLALHAVPGLTHDDMPIRARLALRKTDPRPVPGDWITVRGRLTTLPLPVAPGGYDFARYAFFNGMGAYGFSMGPAQVVAPLEPPDASTEFNTWVAGVRADASARIQAALPGSSGAIAAALTVGDRSEIAAEDDQAMRDSSLAHVLSISGLHMAIIGLGIFGLVRFAAALIPAIALRFQVKKWAALAALLGALGYLLLSGASVPAQRSFLMIGLMFVAVMLDRAPFTLRLVAISAMIVLIISPHSVVDPSFQMSFAAVTALVAAFEAFEAWQKRRGSPVVLRDTWTGRALYVLLAAVLSSMVAGFATAPFAAYHFNRVALYGVFANVAAMPIISFVIMPFAALTLVALPFGLEAWPLAVTGWGIDAMLWIAHTTAALPGAATHVPSMSGLALGLITLGGLWLCLWRGRIRLLGLAPVAAALALGLMSHPPDILIDRDAKNVAVREANGQLALLSGRRAKFAATEWLERDGDSREVKDAARAGREGVWACADKICAAELGAVRIGYMERAGDERAACAAQFDILVAARPIGDCYTGLIITRDTTARNGAMAIYLTPAGITVDTVRAHTGDRPWTVWKGGDEDAAAQ
jgi:competence protein ComEC